MKHHYVKNNKGFTLMEVMVAVSIFTIIVTVGIVALLTINDTYKKSQIERQTVDTISFVLEGMSRSLRTAKSWDEINTIPNSIEFTDQSGQVIIYSFLTDANGFGYVQRDENGSVIRLTTESLDIQDMRFNFSGDPASIQSYLQIQIRGIMKTGRQESPFSIQTGISKRALDF